MATSRDSVAFARMLDVSLDEVVGELGPPDVAARVLQCVRERGLRRESRARHRFVAVALVAVALLSIWIGVRSWPSPRPVVCTTEAGVSVHRGAGDASRTREVLAGDLVVADRSTGLELRDKVEWGTVELDVAAAVQLFEGGILRPVAGRLSVSVTERQAGLRLRTAFGDIEVAEGRAELDVARLEPFSPQRAASQLALGRLPALARVDVRVAAGSVSVLTARGDARAIEGETITLTPDAAPVVVRPLNDADIAGLEDLFARVRVANASIDLKTGPGAARAELRQRAGHDLLDLLTARPDVWSWARVRIRRWIRADSAADVRQRLYAILAHDPDRDTYDQLVRTMRTDSVELGVDAVLVLAERERPDGTKLDAMAAVHEVFEATKQSGGLPFVPAAWLVMRGDAPSRGVLRQMLRMPFLLLAEPDAYLASALAMSRGGDDRAWGAAWSSVGILIDQSLAVGSGQGFERARDLCLRTEWFHGFLQREKLPPLGAMTWRVDRYVRDRADTLQDAAAVGRRFAELER